MSGQSDLGRGLFVSQFEAPLLDAVLRLTRLLERPQDIRMLAPLAMQEIIYHLLVSKEGGRLRQITAANSQTQRVARAINWIKENYAAPLHIEELARELDLSASALHHQFKAVTALSPLQYQKRLRLQEARRLMISEALDAQEAGARVG